MSSQERLYNGILLPHEWPPRLDESDFAPPLPAPYLDHPPEVIPIDVGRQLFVDDFLIERSTLERQFHAAEDHPANPVLKPETPLEMDHGECPLACPFNDGAWHDPTDGRFKLWYNASWADGNCLALSDDGVHWTRPDLDVVAGTNRTLAPRPGYRRDGSCVWLDHEARDPAQRFKLFLYSRHPGGQGGEFRTSPDGIHWGAPTPTIPCGDNSTFFYNPFRKKWVFSIRASKGERIRRYREHSDFAGMATGEADSVFWQRADDLDLPDPAIGDATQLYDLNAVAYESLMLGAFAIFRGPQNNVCAARGVPKTIDMTLGFSRDGFHWSRPNREPFIASSRKEGTWNRAYIHAAGGVCQIVGDRLHFYYGAFRGESPRLKGAMEGRHSLARVMYSGASTGIAVLRRDGFASLRAGAAGGELTSRPVTFSGQHLFVNADAARGELRAQVLARDGRPIPGCTLDECIPVSADGTKQRIRWKVSGDLSRLSGTPVKFRFRLTDARLYSFWVSRGLSGFSSGCVAAGGPGFSGPVDDGTTD